MENIDFPNVDISNVTDFSNTFKNCTSLNSISNIQWQVNSMKSAWNDYFDSLEKLEEKRLRLKLINDRKDKIKKLNKKIKRKK